MPFVQTTSDSIFSRQRVAALEQSVTASLVSVILQNIYNYVCGVNTRSSWGTGIHAHLKSVATTAAHQSQNSTTSLHNVLRCKQHSSLPLSLCLRSRLIMIIIMMMMMMMMMMMTTVESSLASSTDQKKFEKRVNGNHMI